MAPNIKSILSCLVILATASDIHTKLMQKLGSPKQLVVLQNKNIVFGEGMKPGQLPILAYSLEEHILNLSIYFESSRCDFWYEHNISTSIEFKVIKQLTLSRILIFWIVANKDAAATKVVVIYKDSCYKKMTYYQVWPLSSEQTLTVVSFINGYDIITSQNHRLRFDTDGNQLSAEAESFPVNSNDFSVSAVSERTLTNGYFIVDRTHEVVKFTILDERKKEWKNSNLLYLTKAQVLTNNEQSLYSACAFNPQFKNDVACYQYDKLGNEKLMRSAELEFDTVMDVKSVAGGGFVFVTFKFKGQFNQLNFVKIGIKLGDVNIWSYSGKENFQGAKLLDFSEKDHTFVLAYQISQIEEEVLKVSVVSQTYSLKN